MQDLEFRWICCVTTRHAEIAKNELREERQIESDELDHHCRARPELGIHAARHLAPPEMHAAKEAHERATDHDIMEVGNDKVGIGQMHIEAKRRNEKTRH